MVSNKIHLSPRSEINFLISVRFNEHRKRDPGIRLHSNPPRDRSRLCPTHPHPHTLTPLVLNIPFALETFPYFIENEIREIDRQEEEENDWLMVKSGMCIQLAPTILIWSYLYFYT